MSKLNIKNNLEDTLVEIPTVNIFKELNWETINAFNEFENGESILNREEKNEVILISRLRDSLIKLNPGIPINSINEAIEEFTRDRTSMSSLKANEEIYRYLKHGMKVKM